MLDVDVVVRMGGKDHARFVYAASTRGDRRFAPHLPATVRALRGAAGFQQRLGADAAEAVLREHAGDPRCAGRLRELLLGIPNLPHPDAPDGGSDADNPVVRGPSGLPDTFPEHRRVPHWETGEALGILDNERAVKISGAMFTMQRGAGATLARAPETRARLQAVVVVIRVGEFELFRISAAGNGFQVFRSHHGAHSGSTVGMGAFVHNIGNQNHPLTCRSNGGYTCPWFADLF